MLAVDLIDIVERITKREKWPDFGNADRLEKMEDLANRAYRRRSIDGCLSYVLITQQIGDELTRLLIAHCRFTLQLFLVPVGFDYKFSGKPNNSDLDKLTSGQLLNVLDNSLEFEGKDEFLKSVRALTEKRNVLAHHLARQPKLGRIREIAKEYRTKFAETEEIFWEANDVFYLFYKDQRKEDHWEWLLDDALENAADSKESAAIKRLQKLRKEEGFSDDL